MLGKVSKSSKNIVPWRIPLLLKDISNFVDAIVVSWPLHSLLPVFPTALELQ